MLPIIETNNSDREIDGTGLTLLPGVIDPQIHFREPGQNIKKIYLQPVVLVRKVGVTFCLEMPNTHPLTTNQEALDGKLN